ncbi:MAG: VOC family protein, partial [Acidobacteriota bacterium]
VRDLSAAIEFYTQRLGFSIDFAWGEPPTYAGVRLGRVSVHLTEGERPVSGSKVYFVIDALDPLYAKHATAAVEIVDGPENCPWGMREHAVRDLDGHVLRFGQPIPVKDPPLAIERAEVTARIESRLAGLLDDLARHKGMTLGECLEEIVLHSFERVGDEGTASPHDRPTFDHLDELKQRHGLDYDTHACYRFVEPETDDSAAG